MGIRVQRLLTALANTFTQPQTITVNSASSALKVTQAGAGAALTVEDVASDTTPFIVDASGNVGVQKDVPTQPLHVAGIIRAERSGTPAQYVDLYSTGGEGKLQAVATVLTLQGIGSIRFNESSTERMRIDSNGLITGTGTSLGTMVAYTPTWTNLTVGNGTVDFKYTQIGKRVFVSGRLVFGSTTSITGGGPTFTLPVTSAAIDQTRRCRGEATLYDNGTETYFGTVQLQSTTTAWARVYRTDLTYQAGAAIDATAPFTWTTSDEFLVNFNYEAA